VKRLLNLQLRELERERELLKEELKEGQPSAADLYWHSPGFTLGNGPQPCWATVRTSLRWIARHSATLSS